MNMTIFIDQGIAIIVWVALLLPSLSHARTPHAHTKPQQTYIAGWLAGWLAGCVLRTYLPPTYLPTAYLPAVTYHLPTSPLTSPTYLTT